MKKHRVASCTFFKGKTCFKSFQGGKTHVLLFLLDVTFRRVGGTNRKGSVQVQQVPGFEKYDLCRRSFQIPAVPYDQRQGWGNTFFYNKNSRFLATVTEIQHDPCTEVLTWNLKF